MTRSTRTFIASFLVLFLEIALIRWMPAYIRLLSYFSNFILLASFLGIGLGCLLAPARTRLFNWFPLLQAATRASARNPAVVSRADVDRSPISVHRGYQWIADDDQRHTAVFHGPANAMHQLAR